MNKTFQDIARIIAIIAIFALKHERDGNGEAKEKAVSEEVYKVIDEKDGVDLAPWLDPIVRWGLPYLIGSVVRKLNKMDLLGKPKNG